MPRSQIPANSFLRLWRAAWGLPFYQPRLDSKGAPVRARRLFTGLNQRLIESGFSVPWVWSSRQCQDYWASQDNETINSPAHYAAKDQLTGNFIARLLEPHVHHEASILELGSNCGLNLDCLRRAGFRNLAGIDICTDARTVMKQIFPDLNADLRIGSLEEVLPRLPSASHRVVLSVATFMAIHPSSNLVFREAVRVSGGFICTIEPEVANNCYVFIRNYRRQFERLGCRQLAEVFLDENTTPPVSSDHYGFTARLFSTVRNSA